MRIQLLSTAFADIAEAQIFYEQQQDDLGVYFQDAIFADIDSLIVYTGVHSQFLDFIAYFQKYSLMHSITKLRLKAWLYGMY